MNEARCRESMVCGRRLRGVAVGAGYFSQFHYDAWQRIEEATLVALCNRDRARGDAIATRYGVPKVYSNLVDMLDTERPDFIDVITPPDTHAEFCALAAERGIDIMCQKALARTFEESAAIVSTADAAGVRLMVHDNFRFQPWHREMRRLIDRGAIGRLHSISSRTRMGDGWAEDAYLSRQPYFRTMRRLLIFETGVHFIDVFRFLAGEVREVYARLRRLNPVIAGEDCGVVLFEFADGATGVWDANRYNESLESDPRYTFGEFLLEGSQGAIRLLEDGRLLLHPLGGRPQEHAYAHARRGFAGDCCFFTIRHFIDRLLDGRPFETNGPDYLRTLAVQQAVYESAAADRPVRVSY
jgi:predicted dehydrogenase